MYGKNDWAYNIVKYSKYFDLKFYKEKYKVTTDPILHYLEIGYKLDYDTSPNFSILEYYKNNLEVKKAGINPILHYELYGKYEHRDLENGLGPDFGKITPRNYDFFMSLGRYCHCSMHLRKLGLQKKSLPFDWSGGKDEFLCGRLGLGGKVNLILNDFKNLLNFEDLVEFEINKFKDPHRHIYNSRTGLMYLHDFPKDELIEESFVHVKEKYNRRIKRFQEYIERAEKIAFVFINGSRDQIGQVLFRYSDEELLKYIQLLKNKFHKEIDFIFFEHDPTKMFLQVEEYQNQNVIRYFSNHIFQEDNSNLDSCVITIKNILSNFTSKGW